MAAVVGAAIVRDGRILAARRTSPPEAAGRWEFPGGKVEPGESPEDALVREVAEELGCTVTVGRWLPGEVPIGDRHVLSVALVTLVDGEPEPIEHDAAAWLGPDDLDDVDWLEPDRPFLPGLRNALSRLSAMSFDQRILLVHAHPDDESIGQGATMAKYVAEGRGVTLVTCTAGEMGEILVPELEHLAADRDDGLGLHRRGELAEAMKTLGVTDHRYLGGFGTYRDSGMKWHDEGYAVPADDVHDNAFWHADLTEAADHLVEVIREVRPQVLVTYDQFGGYGHPDHIQAHRVATYGVSLAAVPSYRKDLGEAWDVAKVYWGAMSESRMRAGLRALRDSGDTTTFEGMDPDGPLPHFVTADENLAAAVDAREYVERKLEAMRAHATQITTDGPFFALSNNQGSVAWGVEYFRIAKGERGELGEDGLETDLFVGL